MPSSAPHRPAPRPSASLAARPLSWVLAWRFLKGRRTQLLGGTARAAILATALGVTAMIIAMALMSGYREGLRDKLVSGNSAILVQPLLEEAQVLTDGTIRRIQGFDGVASVEPVAYSGQGLSVLNNLRADRTSEVTLRGAVPGDKLLQVGAEAVAAEAAGGRIPIAVGDALAADLQAEEGDVLQLVTLRVDGRGERPRFHYNSAVVSKIYATGFSEFDRQWAVMERERLLELVGRGAVRLYEVTLDDPDRSTEVAEGVREAVGNEWVVTDWRELNQELFTALEVQQRILFLILGLIVLVSTFNVASTLVVLVRERMRDIGVLAAMGLDPGRLRRAFLLYGALLGTVGIGLGVAVGAGAAYLLDRYELIRFNADVAAIYFIRSVPFRVEGQDVAAVVAFAVGINLLACLLPAWWAARVEPSRALRYE